jgi:hypothetical protein
MPANKELIRKLRIVRSQTMSEGILENAKVKIEGAKLLDIPENTYETGAKK